LKKRPSCYFLLVVATILFSGTSQALQTYSFNGMTGHLSTTVNGGMPKEGFQYGLSFYSSVYTLNPSPAASTQLGWGTWFIPENLSFEQPLCPVGTIARDNWHERGPTYRDVYQTLEGGIGQWGSTHFPSSIPKFRVNGVPDCYNNQLGSTGWKFGGELLTSDKLGLAQLSNRLLLAPDGVTFTNVTNTSLLGNGWIALPLIPAYTSPIGVPTGDQSWTLFFHADNFKGPVAFFTPETWSAVNAVDTTGIGRGHDARPAFAGGLAIEIGMTPMFTGQDNTGARYRRIPRLIFPVDPSGTAVLQQDVNFYSKQAIWDGVAAWLENGTEATQMNAAGLFAPPIQGSSMGVTLGGASVTFDASFVAGAVQTSGATSFGMQWSGTMEPGVIPEYYKEDGATWRPVTVTQVPPETGLVNQLFPPAQRQLIPVLDQSSSSPWTSEKWIAGPFTVELSDSSFVDYVWYKFIDQPAITRLGLSQEVLQKLQTFVESLHEQSGLNGITIPPPSSGDLVTIDNALLVTPPAGLEKGYVPVVISQYRPVSIGSVEMAALESLYNATNGTNWSNATNWFTGTVDTWHGITVQGDRIVGIDLFNNGLTGTIPPELGNLTRLKTLELSQNQLSGSIPPEFGNLTALTFFSVYNNDLTGSIPFQMGNLTELTLLQLGANQLTGALPEEFGQLTKLQHLFINDNQFSGPLPLSLQNLNALTSFTFQVTQLCVPQDSAFQAWLGGVASVTSSGLTCEIVSDVDLSGVPLELTLGQNYPNPFNPQTTIEYTLPERSYVLLTIYDALGREIRTLVNAQVHAGAQRAMWDGRDVEGTRVASGPYYYRLLVNGNAVVTKKLLLLK